MRIFFVTISIDDSTGTGRTVSAYIRELVRRGHRVFVFSPCQYKISGTESYQVRMGGPEALKKFRMSLYSNKAVGLAKKFKPDIVHSYYGSYSAILGDKIKKELGIPHVTTVEVISSKNTTLHMKLCYAFEKFFLPRLNYDIITIWTEGLAKRFLRPWGIPNNKIRILPGAVNTEEFKHVSGDVVKKKFGKKLITSLRFLSKTNCRGIENIIRSMKYVFEKHPEYNYLIVGNVRGNPNAASLKSLAESLGLGDKIKFWGPVSIQMCKRVYDATDVAPHSFTYETSMSVSVLEYMAYGVPCVITDVGDVREYVGNAALLVKPGDPRSMAEGIIKLIESPKLRKELGGKARKRIQEKYSVRSIAREFEKIYSGLLSGKGYDK